MRWLLHGSVSPAAAEALKRHGEKVEDAAPLGLPADAPPLDVLKAAKKAQLDILCVDSVLAHTPFEADYYFDRCIVLLQVQGGDVEQNDAIDRLFARFKRLVGKRLYTVTANNVKVRQLPHRQ
jgi:hypothetical protein